MNNIQYTIRKIPEPVDAVLRKNAKRRGVSFNQAVVDALAQATGTAKTPVTYHDLDWFIGSGKDMTKEEREAEEKACAWLDNLPREIETFDD